MLNVTKLLTGTPQPMDDLRYGIGKDAPASAGRRKPVVVWNVTRTCNLRCIHCYSDSDAKQYPGELTHEEGRAVLRDLAAYGVPAVLLSGGEPLARPDTLDLAAYGASLGLRFTLSTNGTLIDEARAHRIREIGFTYVGISLDGIGPTNDRFRGKDGAFERAVRGIRNCKKAGQKVGLRLTLTRHNVQDLDAIFSFIEEERIERACFYHLVPAGRGVSAESLDADETRRALDTIFDRTRAFAARGDAREILTVDNHADGPYLYRYLAQRDPVQASRAYALMRWNGGARHSSGTGIADIDWLGNVHPDQFSQSLHLGNVRTRPFSEIWSDTENPALNDVRSRREHLHGRCASCRFLDICGGGFRARAFNATGDPFASDPGCMLADAEIA